jgi:alanine dehydrogenase
VIVVRIGVPRETKVHEYRVGLTPSSVKELTAAGHAVLVEPSAGNAIGVSDADYLAAGATMAEDAAQVFADAELIVKVKEPSLEECAMLRPGQLLFTYLHLAAARPQAEALREGRVTAIAYETVTADDGSLPLLTPMSEVAGRMSIQVGANFLQKPNGGEGILLGGVPGVEPARVVIIGGGVAGTNAAEMAVGMQADVTVIDRSVPKLRELSLQFGSALKTSYSTRAHIEDLVAHADLVIGSVLIPGDSAPKLVTAEMVRHMKRGSVMVDISIDQGGCFETSRPTNHAEPTFVVDDVVHYCVTNMPGAVPRTSAFALNNATLPFVMELADKGFERAMRENPHFAAGLNLHDGEIRHDGVAHALRAA